MAYNNTLLFCIGQCIDRLVVLSPCDSTAVLFNRLMLNYIQAVLSADHCIVLLWDCIIIIFCSVITECELVRTYNYVVHLHSQHAVHMHCKRGLRGAELESGRIKLENVRKIVIEVYVYKTACKAEAASARSLRPERIAIITIVIEYHDRPV